MYLFEAAPTGRAHHTAANSRLCRPQLQVGRRRVRWVRQPFVDSFVTRRRTLRRSCDRLPLRRVLREGGSSGGHWASRRVLGEPIPLAAKALDPVMHEGCMRLGRLVAICVRRVSL